MPICDMHIHTRVSEDADQSLENNTLTYCKTAIERGIKHIAFTEHYDIIPDPGAVTCNLDDAKRAVLEAREVYGDKIDIIHGIELAHTHRPECAKQGKEVLERIKPDFVLGSLHINDDGTDYYTTDFSKSSDAELLSSLDDYLEQITLFANTCDFDSLAHCTYPFRYFHKNSKLDIIDLEKYKEPYAELFKALIRRGKCLEVNTSTLRSDYGEPLPCFELIKLYVELGGKKFTLGSDSHHFDLVGTKIDQVVEFLKSISINGIYTYHQRQESFYEFSK